MVENPYPTTWSITLSPEQEAAVAAMKEPVDALNAAAERAKAAGLLVWTSGAQFPPFTVAYAPAAGVFGDEEQPATPSPPAEQNGET